MKKQLTFISNHFDYSIAPIILGVLVAIGTFPAVSLSYNLGIDGPMMWLSNYFFSQDLLLGKDTIFPHGPLAFIVYPLASNIGLSLGAGILLKIILKPIM